VTMYRSRHAGGAPSGWGLPPTWGQPLDDPLPLRAAGQVGRWLWPTLAATGFLLVTGFTLAHDDPTPGVSARALLTIALAAAAVVLLTIRRTAGPRPLARALFEYAVVFLLAVLVATTGVPLDHAPTGGKQAGGKQASVVPDQRPALVKTLDGLGDWLNQWRAWARTQHKRGTRPPSTTTEPTGEAMPRSPALPSSSTRRPL
jgi:hypothetical protein